MLTAFWVSTAADFLDCLVRIAATHSIILLCCCRGPQTLPVAQHRDVEVAMVDVNSLPADLQMELQSLDQALNDGKPHGGGSCLYCATDS